MTCVVVFNFCPSPFLRMRLQRQVEVLFRFLLRLKITLGDRSKKKLGRLFKQMIVFLDTLMSTCTSLLASIVLHGVYLYFWTSGMISVLILYGLI